MASSFKNIGPAVLVAAAFIGPGTVTICSLSGFEFGYALLWALLCSILATIVLQEMSARLGIITQKGLGQNLMANLPVPAVRVLAIMLILFAILIGNTAYEAGNISGAALGLEVFTGPLGLHFGSYTINLSSIIIGIIALALIYRGSYALVQQGALLLLLLMSISFLLAIVIIKPNVQAVLSGVFMPSMPAGSTWLILGLVGTTIVPYNLFLHAAAVSERWKNPENIKNAQQDTFLAIGLGGLVSMAIIIVSASDGIKTIASAADLTTQLSPALGKWSEYLMGTGLFAAGLSSAVTAALGAAYATAGVLSMPANLSHKPFKRICMAIIIVGMCFSALGFSFIEIIKTAQVANGILLPAITIFLVWITSKTAVLGDYRNKWWQNVLGVIIILIALLIGGKSIYAIVC